MAKKMFRKLIMISAVLLVLVSGPANADCFDTCATEFNDCMYQVEVDYFSCLNMIMWVNQAFDDCVLWCIQQGGSSYYCEQIICVGFYVDPEYCADIGFAAAGACEDDYDDCLDACY